MERISQWSHPCVCSFPCFPTKVRHGHMRDLQLKPQKLNPRFQQLSASLCHQDNKCETIVKFRRCQKNDKILPKGKDFRGRKDVFFLWWNLETCENLAFLAFAFCFSYFHSAFPPENSAELKNSSMELSVIWGNFTCSDLACSDLACSDLAHSDLAHSDLAHFFCQNSYFFHLIFTTWELI